MGMQTCVACGAAARSTRLAVVVDGETAPRRGRVCGGCAKRGLFIVPVKRAKAVFVDKAEKKEAREVLAPFARRCEALARARAVRPPSVGEHVLIDSARNEGAVEAYEAIAHMLKEGRA